MKNRAKKRLLAVALTGLMTQLATGQVAHEWAFDDVAGTLITGAANTGTPGGVSFAGGDSLWTTNGSGGLEMKSTSGGSLIQSNANMGTGMSGSFMIRYDISWEFGTPIPGLNQEMFLISRTSSGASPSGNMFRFSVSIFSGTSGGSGGLSIATQTYGVPTSGNYTFPVTIADLNTVPAGSVSLRAAYTFSSDNSQMDGVVAEYSLDGGASWNQMNLGGSFTPYAISDLGDLRIHTKGTYSDTNYYTIDGITVTLLTQPFDPVTVPVLAGAAIEISCPSAVGYRYQLQVSSTADLSGWKDVDGEVQDGTGADLLFTPEAPAAAGEKTFYRVRVSTLP